MSRRKQQKCRLEVEGLEARDMLSASGLPFYTGIVRAGAVVAPQAVDQSKVCLDAVVVTPEGHPPTVTCPADGLVPNGQETARITTNHNETLVLDRARIAKRQ